MEQNAYNKHSFTVTKKVTEDQIKNLQEVLKLYEKWLKTSSEDFDYIMPITFLSDLDEIATDIKVMCKRQREFITEVLKATKSFK